MEYALVALVVVAGIASWFMSKGKKKKPLSPDEQIAQLQVLLADKDQATYQKAIVILGRIDHPQAPAILSGMLRDKRPRAASTALKVLLEKGDEHVVESLGDAMGALIDSERAAIIEILGQKMVQGAADLVAPYLQSEDPEIQRATAEALGRLGDTRMAESLAQLMEQSVSYVEMASAFALVKLGDPRGFPKLQLKAMEEERGTRTRLAAYLGEIRTPEANQLLMELVKDRDHFVKAKAILALGNLKDPSVAPIIVEALGDYYEGVTKAAHKALVEMAGTDLGKDQAAWQQWLEQGCPVSGNPGKG